MPKIKVNDIEMYYEIHGSGEPIVFVSGFSADHLGWGAILPAFAQEHQVILLNNRGAGQSDVPQGPYSIKLLADDVAELCHQLNIPKAHFVGNSMGGFIVQTLAYHYPDLVKSVVISNSAMAPHTPFHFFVDAQLELRKANAPIKSLIKASCSWGFSYQFLSHPGRLDQLMEWGMANPYPFTVDGHHGQYAALGEFDSSAWAKEIKAPALVITGDQDIILRPALSEDLAKTIPGARYYCFENCGHLPHLEYPQQYFEVVKEFIS